jgi:hypothetical protein
MSALNYSVFVDKVENGTKRQTIRADRKHPFKVGDRLYHFTGMRTKKCRRLRADIEDRCTQARKIVVRFTQFSARRRGTAIWIDGVMPRDVWELQDLARADGFGSIGAFMDFFQRQAKPVKGRPRVTQFSGQIIHW